MKRFGPALALAAVIVVAIAVGVLVSGGADDGPESDEARLVVNGVATVEDVDGGTRQVTDTETVATGEIVSMDEGTATLELADGATYELRADAPGSRVEMAVPPALLDGELLVAAGFPARVSIGDLVVSADGATQVDAATVRVFGGVTRLSGAGVDEVPALRALDLAAGTGVRPVTYDGADEWDRRFLGEAIAFGERLEALARGYTSELRAGGPRGVFFFESVIPQLATEQEFGDDLLDPGRDLGETLVGAAITVQGRDGTFRQRWAEVFTFRDQGAAWGLVALDQGVSAAPVLETIELAIDDTPAVIEDQPRPTTTTTVPGPPPTTTPDPGDPDPPPTTEPPPPPPEDGGPLDPILEPLPPAVGEPVQDLLDALDLGG